jgi:hypothetical protein
MNMDFLRLRVLKAASLAVLVLIPAACGDDDPTGPGGGGSSSSAVTLSVGVPAAGPSAAITPNFSFDIKFGVGSDTLNLTRVALVVRNIKLERQFDDCSESGGSDDGCEEFEAGPVIVELPMSGGLIPISVSNVPVDIYDELRFKIHKPEDNTPEDLAFLAANPQFDGVSIRVEGTFNNGTPFVFETDLNEEQRQQLSPPFDVTADSGPLNVTLSVDVETWFKAADGSLIDPLTANKGEVNEQIVKDNIEASIDIFEDNDKDGSSDD